MFDPKTGKRIPPCPFCGSEWHLESGTKNAICTGCKIEVYHDGDYEKLCYRDGRKIA